MRILINEIIDRQANSKNNKYLISYLIKIDRGNLFVLNFFLSIFVYKKLDKNGDQKEKEKEKEMKMKMKNSKKKKMNLNLNINKVLNDKFFLLRNHVDINDENEWKTKFDNN